MYAMPRVAQQRKAVANVTTTAPQMRRYRAVVVRSIEQRAVVEFDAMEGSDPYLMGQEIVAQVAPEAWVSGDPGYAYVRDMDEIYPDGSVESEGGAGMGAEMGDD